MGGATVSLLTQSFGDEPEDAFRTGDPFDVTYRVIVSGDQVKYVHEQGVIFFDRDRRKPERSMGVVQDITIQECSRQDLEQALLDVEESEHRQHQLFDNMNDGVAVYRAVDEGDDFVFVDYNQAAEQSTQIRCPCSRS